MAETAAARRTMIDPNIRPGFITDEAAYRARIDRMIAAADIVKLSDEDLHWLAGRGRRRRRSRAASSSEGPKLVCITEGARGVTGYTATGARHAAAPRVDGRGHGRRGRHLQRRAPGRAARRTTPCARALARSRRRDRSTRPCRSARAPPRSPSPAPAPTRPGATSSDARPHLCRLRLMRALVQRVTRAAVSVDGEIIGEIGAGLLILVCAMRGDDATAPSGWRRKVARLRIFRDDAGRDEPLAPRHRRRRAGGQPVHARRRHRVGQPPRLFRRRPARGRRGRLSRLRRRRSPPRASPSPPAGSAPTWRWSWSTTGR